jgi:hypothetical protein
MPQPRAAICALKNVAFVKAGGIVYKVAASP